MAYSRYAIYYLPAEGELARRGAAWLGWDCVAGHPVPQPDIEGLAAITDGPAKYGFHATLKPPFRLAPGQNADALLGAVEALADDCAPPGDIPVALATLGRFLALVPQGEAGALNTLAARCVQELDPFRAEMTSAEYTRRLHPGLSPTRRALLQRWGYPHVLEAFRFHMTLTGRLPREEIPGWKARLKAHFEGVRLSLQMRAIAVVGERTDGFFERIGAFDLRG